MDVTPARHLPVRATGTGGAALEEVGDRLADALSRTAELAPAPASSARRCTGRSPAWAN